MRQLNSTIRVQNMNIETTKQQLQELVNTVNSSPQRNKVEFDIQDKTPKHMSIINANGRLCVNPTTKGYGYWIIW
jgi:K+-sensing histidine kinase KdpD